MGIFIPRKSKDLIDQRLVLRFTKSSDDHQIDSMAASSLLKILAVGGFLGNIIILDTSKKFKKIKKFSILDHASKADDAESKFHVNFLNFSVSPPISG